MRFAILPSPSVKAHQRFSLLLQLSPQLNAKMMMMMTEDLRLHSDFSKKPFDGKVDKT
jgi:hypothetical protein